MLKTLNKWIFYAALVTLIPAFMYKDSFPDPEERQYGSLAAPLQSHASKPGFQTVYAEVNYSIEPRYDYELTGLVVSQAVHNAKYGLHRRWNDHLNVADLCVVWGDNAGSLDLNAFEFRNGQFTCNISTGSSQAWRAFKMNELSNNHLLSDDETIREQIQDVRIGDRIHLQGWLSRYGNDQGFSRDTSTTREDSGNGACETIFVNRFEIIDSMHNSWRGAWSVSLFAAVSSALIWLVAVGRGRW
ncbi:MAG TPA: hypothetical protein ENJ80_08810 [Gammaproteobacteria bacterium]|nr:hypothetical protein [Gammaproteobacteria bacterium]